MGIAVDSALTIALSDCHTRILELARKIRSRLSGQSPANPAPSLRSTAAQMKKAVAMLRWPFDKKECLAVISERHAL